MKKNFKGIGRFIGIIIFLISCSQQNLLQKVNDISIENGIIKKTFYEKDVHNSFLTFLENPDEKSKQINNLRSASRAENNEINNLTEEEMFSQMWIELSDEKKQLILKNLSSIDIKFESEIGINVNSYSGRSAVAGSTKYIDNLAEYYGIFELLKEIANNQKISEDKLKLDFDISSDTEINAEQLLELYLRSAEWEKFQKVLKLLDKDKYYKDIKKRWDKINIDEDFNFLYTRSSSSSKKNYDIPLVENVGEKINDGDILLTSAKKKPYVICGEWSHGGIFSKDDYELNGNNDASYCVYTAEPGDYDANYKPQTDTDPDRWGVACKETIFKYTKSKKFSVVRPKEYTEEKAKNAVKIAKTIYYDTLAPYNLPLWEILFLGNSSHDLTNKNTYCTKVVYTAWKKNGVDLDSRNFAGNLVSPDEIFGSSVRRINTIIINLGFWKYSKSWVVYEPTTNVIMEEYR